MWKVIISLVSKDASTQENIKYLKPPYSDFDLMQVNRVINYFVQLLTRWTLLKCFTFSLFV